MYDQVADYLNNIEEVACGLSCKELIEKPIRPEDIRTTPVANIKKAAESPGARDMRAPSRLQPHCTAHGRAQDTEKR